MKKFLRRILCTSTVTAALLLFSIAYCPSSKPFPDSVQRKSRVNGHGIVQYYDRRMYDSVSKRAGYITAVNRGLSRFLMTCEPCTIEEMRFPVNKSTMISLAFEYYTQYEWLDYHVTYLESLKQYGTVAANALKILWQKRDIQVLELSKEKIAQINTDNAIFLEHMFHADEAKLKRELVDIGNEIEYTLAEIIYLGRIKEHRNIAAAIEEMAQQDKGAMNIALFLTTVFEDYREELEKLRKKNNYAHIERACELISAERSLKKQINEDNFHTVK